LENLDNDGDINGAWKNIKESIKASAADSLGLQEFKHHKPRFDEECLGFYIEGNRLKCSGCRIQAKALYRI
jgi:hypothetical protein